MSISTKQDTVNQEVAKKLKQIKENKDKQTQFAQLKEIVKSSASNNQWNLVMEAIEILEDERERNLLIADLIEDHLLKTNEIEQAKKFAKYIIPQSEIHPLVLIRIALAEKDGKHALKIAESLSSPLSRNFAFWHILEFFNANNDEEKVNEISNKMLENIRTIYDPKTRSSILREIAIEHFLAKNDIQRAKEVVNLIPNEEMRKQLLTKIESMKPSQVRK
jgi:hypothetical protein